MTDEVDKRMDKTQESLNDANKKIKDLQEKLTGGNCCIDATLLIVLIACIGFIAWKYLIK